MTNISFLLQRMRHYWQLFVTLALGVILATALLATGPILIDTVIAIGLRGTLNDPEPLTANLRLFAQAEAKTAVFRTYNDGINNFIQSRFDTKLSQIIPSGGTRYLHPWNETSPIARQRVNLRFYGTSDAQLLEKATFVAGAWPTRTDLGGQTAVVVISETMARAYALDVGDQLPLSLRQNDDAPSFWLEVGGIIRPLDSQDPFWFGNLSPLLPQSDARYDSQFSVLIPQAAFFPLAESWFAPSDASLEWFVLLNSTQISTADVPALQALLRQFEEANWDIGDTGVHIDTQLLTTLDDFTSQATAVRTPLLALTATVVLLALYYVTMASALTLQQVEREFAVLRGRGASGWQLVQLQMLEGGLISAVALISGPGLAWIFVTILALIGPLADVAFVEQSTWVARLPAAAWLAAAVGGLACIMSLLLPLPNLLRRTIVSHQSQLSRTNQQPWWQKYYLDVFILLIGLVLLWRLQTTGSIIGGTQEQPRVDWLLLLSPIALMLGAATILLRVFPALLSLGAELTSRGRGLPAALAMWQAARNPTHVARLVLLLTLAMAMGLFSTGLNRALDRNEQDRSRYAAGADLWVQNGDIDTVAVLPTAAGITETAVSWRKEGSLTTRIGTTNPRFDVLAVEPNSFTAISEFRDDFATEPLPALMQQLAFPDSEPLPTLPDQPNKIGIWLRIAPNIAVGLRYQMKVRTAQNEYLSLSLRPVADEPSDETISEPIWAYYEARLPALAAPHYPLQVHSIWIQSRHATFSPMEPIGFDDLTAVSPAGTATIVDSFEQQHSWQATTPEFRVGLQNDAPRSGDSYLLWDDIELRQNRWFGVSQAPILSDTPLPALVSQAFANTADLQEGSLVSTWVDSVPTNFEIVGIVNHFPTMYEEKDAGFLVTTYHPLLTHLNSGREVSNASNEIFAQTSEESDATTVLAGIATLYTGRTTIEAAETIRREIKADPLALGLRSVTLFGYVITAVLSLAGFGVHFYMSARQRELIFGVLRALGLSPKQLYRLLLWEQIVLIFSGLTLGTGLGYLLNQLTLPGLPINLGGRPPVPPFLVETDWLGIGQLYLLLTIAFLLLLAFVVYLLRQSQLHRVLRVGEE